MTAAAISFKYSVRPGTPAAVMADQVPEATKSGRLAQLQALLAEQTRAFNEAMLGRTLPVLFEKPGRHPGQLVGRSPSLQAVHATAPAGFVGAVAAVEIEGLGPNSLCGRLAVAEPPLAQPLPTQRLPALGR